MKTARYIITLAALVVTAFRQALAETMLPAPMPEFMNPAQLAGWRDEKSARAGFGAAQQPAQSQSNGLDAFFTGKAIDSDTGDYLFMFRNYDPELSRWTTSDPSGFPDGSNYWIYIANHAGLGMDPDGLDFLHFDGSSITVWDGSGYQSGGSIDWGNSGQSWAATSGGTGGASPIPDGWYKTSGPMTLGGNEPGHYPEKSITEGDVLFAGTMSSWTGMIGSGYGAWDASWATNRFGFNATYGGTAPTIVEYKIGLAGIHGNNVSLNDGYRIHPTMAGSTTGCIGVTNYSDAVSFQTYINNNIGIELVVE